MRHRRAATTLCLTLTVVLAIASPLVIGADDTSAESQDDALQAGAHNPSTTQPKGDKDRPFVVFDALLFRNRPDLQARGMRRLEVVYPSDVWPSGASRATPGENAVRALARRVHQQGRLVCVDIEHWSLFKGNSELRHENLRKFQNVADWMHAAEPGIRMGFFGQVPQQVFKPIVDNNEQELAIWRRRNEKLDALARHVDVLFPSLYTMTPNRERWRRFAEVKLKAARRYNKQVYPFLFPRFFNSGKPIPGDYWRQQLETCYEHADGLVIWGGYRKQWNPDAEWWQHTKAFLRQLRK